MKSLLIQFSVLFLVAMSTFVFADVYEEGKITRLQVEGDSLVLVWLDGPDDTSECSNGGYWSVHVNDKNYQGKLALLMSAEATNKMVKLRHLSSWSCGAWNTNKIYSIQRGPN